jgi:hypothetical protein
MDHDRHDLGTCAAADCFEPASTIGLATLTLNPLVGAAPEDDPLVIEVPLCGIKHAHLLRMGVTRCDFDNRMD